MLADFYFIFYFIGLAPGFKETRNCLLSLRTWYKITNLKKKKKKKITNLPREFHRQPVCVCQKQGYLGFSCRYKTPKEKMALHK